ncbi:MAG: ArsR family transcriptional regulator [Phenylobacterium sp.]|jgi:Lrp/AsnC family leucine-responsive transcriptional regulator|uniref:Lrp/AsnC ligand binding domain-containing protein n=1 Tax=Phenylobacterium sp. TaxID=1871053 RepID=UPI002629B8FB|nr:Lrp/AsnC ligand binding domain-containing protein [Phenylobacterium sp.]MDB5427744.1 ArsR family transcriptional regulator [Phenylobacterium sp.]MDB5497204.1 ArsR family transcriptional regulator [Phenylobacterium sp.]
MATSYRIDDTDRRILRVLQVDGRISNQDLALRCNLSPSACSDRVRRLREQGIISGYAAVLDPSKVDRPLLIFVEVVLDRTTGDVFEAFAAAARRSPEVMECHMVAGGFDYLIKARVRDMAAYRRFLGEVLVEMPGVRETRTYAVLEEIKASMSLPI